MKYRGRVISATAPVANTSQASGIWFPPQQMQGVRGAAWPTGTSGFLFPFTTFTFGSAGSTGRYGPNSAALLSAYAGQPWVSNYFSVPIQGVQRLVVPATGTYRVTAAGARGGGTGSQGDVTNGGGSGRIIVANVALTQGDYVYILVGQVGGAYSSTSQGSGGGGGTFFSTGATWETSTLLVAAGGGGGASGGNGGTVANQNGQTGTAGGGWGGGTNGNGGTEGSGSEQGAPGGGWFSGGLGSSSYPGAQIRSSATATGAQSPYGDSSNVGGFGGGASGWGASGGGGGYSGGGAQSTTTNSSSRTSGGGGGSYNTGTLVSNSGLNYSGGYLTLEIL